MNADVYRMRNVPETKLCPAPPRSSAATGSPSPAPAAPYAEASNQDMLTAALDGLVARFGLQGERLGDVVAGAVLKHSRDFNLTRECVLGSTLDHSTPAHDVQQACDTSLQAGAGGRAQDRARADRGRDRGRRRHDERRAGRAQRRPAARADEGEPEQVGRRAREAARAAAAGPDRARHPAQRRAAHRAVDGRAPGAHDQPLGDHARGAGRARGDEPRARGGGLRARLLRRPRDAVPRARRATRTCGRTRASRSWRSSSRCSARATARR